MCFWESLIKFYDKNGYNRVSTDEIDFVNFGENEKEYNTCFWYKYEYKNK